jgi:hypothetical protein
MDMSNIAYNSSFRAVLTLGVCASLVAACGDSGGDDDTTTTIGSTPGSIAGTMPQPTEDTTPSTLANDDGPDKLDLEETTGTVPSCSADGTCNLLDILFVIDNSGSMGEEQKNLAANFPYLISKIRALKDKKNKEVNANVNIMVTTSDFGHPLCTKFYAPDYTPAKGAPIASACIDRIDRFTAYGGTPSIPEACTAGCVMGAAAVPDGPFINFQQEMNNIIDPDGVGDPVADALACIGPQGIDGCGMEATLETMLQALDPGKDWNKGTKPFLRTGAVLAIIIITDEEDCATKDYTYFDPAKKTDPMYNQYWEDAPNMPGVKDQPTSAVCWNAGTDCPDANGDGNFECVSADKGVLQPLDRYKDYLQDILIDQKNKQVVMLGILGVPPVIAHNPDPPFQPTDGGVFDLIYRDWVAGDILPGDPKSFQQKQYEFGIGPGCSNAATGQAVPPVRIKEVCESLNVADDPATMTNEEKVRCCIESICDSDFSAAIDCLSGILQEEFDIPG